MSQAQLQEQIYKVLLEEMSAYDYLAETVKNKQDAIVRNDIKQLRHLTGVEQVVSRRASRLTTQRADLMTSYQTYSGSDEPIGLNAIIETIPEPQKKSWNRLNKRIKKAIEIIHRKNNENARLIDTSLSYIRGTINLFLPREELTTGIYTNRGRENKKNGLKNLLDCNA